MVALTDGISYIHSATLNAGHRICPYVVALTDGISYIHSATLNAGHRICPYNSTFASTAYAALQDTISAAELTQVCKGYGYLSDECCAG